MTDADTGTVLRYATAAIYTNFSTRILDDECFGADGKFVTGGLGDKLIWKFEKIMWEEGEEVKSGKVSHSNPSIVLCTVPE